jgi:hypothetical protein
MAAKRDGGPTMDGLQQAAEAAIDRELPVDRMGLEAIGWDG